MAEETINSEPVLSQYAEPILSAFILKARELGPINASVFEVIDLTRTTGIKVDGAFGVEFTILNTPSGIRQNGKCICLLNNIVEGFELVGDPYKPFQSFEELIAGVGKSTE